MHKNVHKSQFDTFLHEFFSSELLKSSLYIIRYSLLLQCSVTYLEGEGEKNQNKTNHVT